MITTVGKDVIKQYFGGQVRSIGGALVLGTGATAAALGDKSLAFEVARIAVTAISADLANNRIVFKGTLPPGSVGTVYEIGLLNYADPTDNSKNLGLFEGHFLPWVNGTLVTANARRGAQTLKIDAAASSFTVASISELAIDWSWMLASDGASIAFTADANLDSLKLRIGTDASNYREWTALAPPVGYNAVAKLKSDATVVGAPDESSASYVAVVPTAKAGGATTVHVDGIRLAQNNVSSLVSRHVLTTPEVMDLTVSSEVEYSLGISV